MPEHPDDRFLVLIEEEGSMSSRGRDLPWSEAREVAQSLRDEGAQISIHRVRGGETHCVVTPDDPLDSALRQASLTTTRTAPTPRSV